MKKTTQIYNRQTYSFARRHTAHLIVIQRVQQQIRSQCDATASAAFAAVNHHGRIRVVSGRNLVDGRQSHRVQFFEKIYRAKTTPLFDRFEYVCIFWKRTQKVRHIARTILLHPVRVVQMPHGSIASAGGVVQPQFAGRAAIGHLRELLPHLVLTVLETAAAAGRHVADLVRQLHQQIDVRLPDALQERGQRCGAGTLGDHIETLFRTDRGGYVRRVHVAEAVVARRRQMDAIVVVRQEVRIDVAAAVLVVQCALVLGKLLALWDALELDEQLRIGQLRFENVALFREGGTD